MITRWRITVTDGVDFRKRSREYEIAGNQSCLWTRIAEGMIDELVPNSIDHIEIEYAGTGTNLTIYTLTPTMRGDVPVCQDDACPNANKCANHRSAYDVTTANDNQATDGMSPDLYYDTQLSRWGCTKADTNRYEGARVGAGVVVEETVDHYLEQYLQLKIQYQGDGQDYASLPNEAKDKMSKAWSHLAVAVGNPNRAFELLYNDSRYPAAARRV